MQIVTMMKFDVNSEEFFSTQRDAHDVRCDKYFVSKLMKKNGSDFGRRLDVTPTGLMNDDESLLGKLNWTLLQITYHGVFFLHLILFFHLQ